jgi:hypothetical protein
VSIDWWMSAEWTARDEQPILPTSTNPCITRAAGTQGVKYYMIMSLISLRTVCGIRALGYMIYKKLSCCELVMTIIITIK